MCRSNARLGKQVARPGRILFPLVLSCAMQCRGKLIYVDKEYHEDFTCSPPCRYACQDFSVGAGGLFGGVGGFLLLACLALRSLLPTPTACVWVDARARGIARAARAVRAPQCGEASDGFASKPVPYPGLRLSPCCAAHALPAVQKATPKLDLRVNSKETYIMLVDRGPSE